MIGWAIETLIASSILMLAVLALRVPVARAFGPHIAYGLWLLPALRLLLPPLPEEVAPTPLHMLPAPIDIEALLAMPIPADPVAEAGVNWPLLLGVMWGLGALAFLGWHIWSYRTFVRTTMRDATQLPRFDRDGVEVCASPLAPGPFAAGIFLKTIVLPEDYRRRYEQDELRLAIEHEVQHHRRCDMSANFAALIVLALHWWNPIAYFAHRAFRVDQELACDAVVLARATPAERHAYGSALLKSACGRLPVAACALGAGDDLKRRLRMMKVYRWNESRARAGSLIAAGLVGGGLLLTASNGIAAETSAKVEEQVRTVLAPVVPALAPIAPPAPLAPPAPVAPVEKVQLAMAGHPHPEPPIPPVPPVPPAPPRIDLDGIGSAVQVDHVAIARSARAAAAAAARAAGEAVDQAQIQREVQDELRQELAEARREALREAADARREAAEARQEAMREGAEARREAARARARVASRTCPPNHKVSVQVNGDTQVVRCFGWSEKDKAEFRRTMIASLQSARASIASMDRRHMPEHARDSALRSLDAQLARLRSEK
jgi:bla regulator protein blaR1